MSKGENSKELRAIVEAWLEYHRLHERAGDYEHKTDVGDEKFWAVATLMDAADSEPELCWSAILQLVDRAETDLQRANIAAGPLEDLLAKHGHRFIDRVDDEAAKNLRFQELLSGVWKNVISDDVWYRIEQIKARGG